MKHHLKSTRYVAEQIVALVEKVLGTGFDPTTDEVLVSSLTTLLQDEMANGLIIPVPAPDAHLEMAFEDHISGFDD